MIFQETWARLGRVNRYNLQTLRDSPAAEISGALGDLGTLLPLMIALTIQDSIDLASTLVFSGLFNVATGVVFGVPLPVQPMKAIAAAALARGSTLEETTAAGGWVGAAVLFLSVTGLIKWLTRNIPVPVVKGIQLGAGLRLVISAGSSLILPLRWLSPLLDNRTWAIAAFLILLIITPGTTHSPTSLSLRNKTPPYALVVFILGLCFALLTIVLLEPDRDSSTTPNLPFFSLWHPYITIPTFLSPSSMGMALSQLPLTTLNSIIAAAALADDLFPHHTHHPPQTATPSNSPPPHPSPPSTTSLGISVALMNLTSCFLGCMPLCHGSGGLAAQHRFGARSGSSIILLGLFKLILGLVLGRSLLDLLGAFPRSILGVMVAVAGLELARAGNSLNHVAAGDLFVEEGGKNVGGGGGGGGSAGHDEGRRGGGNPRDRDRDRDIRAGESSRPRRHGLDKQQQLRILSDAERDERWTIMLMTAGGILAFKNDAVGFVAGMLCHLAYRTSEAGPETDGVVEEEEGVRRGTSGRRRRGYGVSVLGRRYLSRRRQRGGGHVRGQTEESPLLESD